MEWKDIQVQLNQQQTAKDKHQWQVDRQREGKEKVKVNEREKKGEK